jgi:hypothetical protein
VQEDKSTMQPYAGRMQGPGPHHSLQCAIHGEAFQHQHQHQRQVFRKKQRLPRPKGEALELSLGRTTLLCIDQCIMIAVMQFPICSTDTKRPECGTVKPLNDLCRNNTVPEHLWTAGADSAVQFNLTGAARPWASRRRHARALFIILWDDLHLDWILGAIIWRPGLAARRLLLIDTRYQPDIASRRLVSALPGTLFVDYSGVFTPKLTTCFRYQRLKTLLKTGS